MYLHDIHNEMKNECGDAQECECIEEDLDPLRSPLPTGSNDWERGFMESMHKAKRNGWTLSEKQIAVIDRIRSEEEGYPSYEFCPHGVLIYSEDPYDPVEDCMACVMEEERRNYAHMTEEQIEAFQDWASEVLGDRDVMSGSYGSVPTFRGPCPLSYNSSGYSGGGYHVVINEQTGMRDD